MTLNSINYRFVTLAALLVLLPALIMAQPRQGARTMQDGTWGARGPAMFADGLTPALMQLDELTDEQQNLIMEMHQAMRAQSAHLSRLLRSGRVEPAAYLERREELFENYQQQLREVLSPAQWTQLSQIREQQTELRQTHREQAIAMRVELIAAELELDKTTTEALVEAAEKHQTELRQVWGDPAAGGAQRTLSEADRRRMMQQNLAFQDEMRAILGDEVWVEWQTLWNPAAAMRRGNQPAGARGSWPRN